MALVDILMALALLGIMSSGLFFGFRAGLTSWIIAQQYAAEQQNGRAVVNRIARSLRMVGYNYAGTAPAVIYGDAHEVDFFADLDGTGTAQCYRFYLNSGVVYEAKVTGTGCDTSIRSAPGQPLTAVMEAKALTFTELDFTFWSAADLGGGQLATPLSSTDRYHVVRVEVTAKVQGESSTEPPVTITTDATVRQTGG